MTSSFLLRKKESCPAGFSACGGLHQQHFHLRRSAILRSIYVIGKNFHALAWQGLSYNRTKWASPLQLPPTPQSLRGASLFARRRNTASRWNSSLRRVHPARRAFYCIGNEVSYAIKKALQSQRDRKTSAVPPCFTAIQRTLCTFSPLSPEYAPLSLGGSKAGSTGRSQDSLTIWLSLWGSLTVYYSFHRPYFIFKTHFI